jgi:hypothetical protein
MVKKYTRVVMLALAAIMVFSCVAMAATTIPEIYAKKPTQYLTEKNWAPWSKKIINQMFDAFGRNNVNYNPENRPWAMFDCDNTISLTDVQEQLFIYQLENLRFAFKPEELYKIATAGVGNVHADLGKDYNHTTIDKLAKDTVKAYTRLYNKGWVAADNSKVGQKAKWMATDDWKEFATKTRLLYDAIGDSESVSVSYPWIGFYFTGMTPAEAEQLAYESHVYYEALGKKDVKNWTKLSWESPKIRSLSGQFKVSFRQSTGVTPEMRELIKKLDANGIDVWICSASPVTTIRGLQRAWNFEGLRGMKCMTYKMKNGKYIAEYDYDLHPQTQGVGKSETFVKTVLPLYDNRGPILGAGDSQGDFNFMTEFKDTVVGLMINRVRKDDAGIVAAIASYQDDNNIDLYEAMKRGEIRFLNQGRDENKGQFRPYPESIMLGKTEPALLHDKAKEWRKMLDAGTTPNQLLNQCTKLTGKLKTYIGTKVR